MLIIAGIWVFAFTIGLITGLVIEYCWIQRELNKDKENDDVFEI
jgi:hypothetical protein